MEFNTHFLKNFKCTFYLWRSDLTVQAGLDHFPGLRVDVIAVQLIRQSVVSSTAEHIQVAVKGDHSVAIASLRGRRGAPQQMFSRDTCPPESKRNDWCHETQTLAATGASTTCLEGKLCSHVALEFELEEIVCDLSSTLTRKHKHLVSAYSNREVTARRRNLTTLIDLMDTKGRDRDVNTDARTHTHRHTLS